jgi:hypothetical protein
MENKALAIFTSMLTRGTVCWRLAFGVRAVASSDATNLRGSIRKEGDEVIVNAHKWVRLFHPLARIQLVC